ncbi:helix-turn-helix domain-containing protein [Parabacteroides goldsteinii]|uniref:helix-turn-helix domain-containing protein n=1 Tax=Parabacteroides goldsteinii TaxID=328812 RepID=UPI0026748B57|nr:helix-turn-helix transcriptional regulator [Parabacteroides goldsteinii]
MFKDRLKYLIDNIPVNNQHVTTYRIGKETTVSRVSVENYLSGKQSPSIEKATIIAQYFNISVNWLLTGEGEMCRTAVQSSMQGKENFTVSKEVWEVIKKQADSLTRKDKQIDDLISMLKKDNALPENDAKCADATGSDK